MQNVVIASRNPVKINATKEAFEKLMPLQEFSFEGISVPSDVADQPMTDQETLTGAANRALNAKSSEPSANYWIGIEGGIEESEDGMEAFAWVVILSQETKGQSRTSTFYLPRKVVELIHQGIELGHANDQVFDQRDSKSKGGAVGTLTNGVLGRTDYYVQAVMLALIPFINQELY
ncbi:MAG: inosine/xanthosine triphosphatase [Cyclobacteriaceae bacterium]